jgi:hypothetical protein
MASTINADDGVVSGSAGVKTSADNSGVLELQSNGTTQFTLGSSSVVINEAGADVDFRVEGDTDANLIFADASTDRVGVGLNNPGVKLHVAAGTSGATPSSDAQIVADSSGNAAVQVLSKSGNSSYLLMGNELVSPVLIQYFDGDPSLRLRCTGASTYMSFSTNNTERMRLDASGNLLVGGTTAVYSAAGRGLVEINGSNNSFLGFTVGGASKGFILHGGTNLTINNAANGDMVFLTNDTERARITSGGVFLIGTTSAVVSGSETCGISGGVGLGVRSTGGTSSFAGAFWNDAGSGDNVLIRLYTESGGIERGTITYNRAGGLVAYNTTSDYRSKNIFGPVQDSGATIDALKVYEGQMKGASQSRPMLVAHEAQEHAPYAVTGEKDAVNEDGTPKYQQIDHSSLVPLLIAEIQSLRARVVALESK